MGAVGRAAARASGGYINKGHEHQAIKAMTTFPRNIVTRAAALNHRAC